VELDYEESFESWRPCACGCVYYAKRNLKPCRWSYPYRRLWIFYSPLVFKKI